MPETRPLRPISQRRIGNRANVMTFVLKSQPLRQLDWFAAEGKGKWRPLAGNPSDTADHGLAW